MLSVYVFICLALSMQLAIQKETSLNYVTPISRKRAILPTNVT